MFFRYCLQASHIEQFPIRSCVGIDSDNRGFKACFSKDSRFCVFDEYDIDWLLHLSALFLQLVIENIMLVVDHSSLIRDTNLISKVL